MTNKISESLDKIPHVKEYLFSLSSACITVYNPYTVSSFAEKRFDADSGFYQSFFTSPYFKPSIVDLDIGDPEYRSSLKGRPIIYHDSNMKLDSGEKTPIGRFLCCLYYPNDPIESILFYDNEKGGGFGISGGKELGSGQFHEIKVQTTVDGKQFVDLSVVGGDTQITLYAKTKTGLTSNPAVMFNGKNVGLAGK